MSVHAVSVSVSVSLKFQTEFINVDRIQTDSSIFERI